MQKIIHLRGRYPFYLAFLIKITGKVVKGLKLARKYGKLILRKRSEEE